MSSTTTGTSFDIQTTPRYKLLTINYLDEHVEHTGVVCMLEVTPHFLALVKSWEAREGIYRHIYIYNVETKNYIAHWSSTGGMISPVPVRP